MSRQLFNEIGKVWKLLCLWSGHKSNSTFLKDSPRHLKEFFSSDTSKAIHFRHYIRAYKNALSKALVATNYINLGKKSSIYSQIVTIQGLLYHDINSLTPPENEPPQCATDYFNDTDYKSQLPNQKENNSAMRLDIREDLNKMPH